MSKREGKYSWVDREFDEWLKEQAQKLRKSGFKTDTVGVSRLIKTKIIIPNNIELKDLIEIKPLKLWGKKKR